MSKHWVAIIFLSSVLAMALLIACPEQYKKGYADGYQERINYEHGK